MTSVANGHPLLTQFTQHLLALQRSPLTIKRYVQGLECLLEQDPTLLALTPLDLRKLLSQRHAQGQAPRSLATSVAAWRSFYDWAVAQHLLASNPCAGLRAPKIAKTLPKAFSVDAALQYLGPARGAIDPAPTELSTSDAAMTLRDQAVLELLYACGLRAAELLSLDAIPSRHASGWLDLAQAKMTVTGKGNKQRSLPIHAVAIAALQAWIAVRGSIAKPSEQALFVGTRGARMGGTELRRITQRQVLKTEFNQPVHPHMLRHSFASHLLQSSGDLRAVQELLGHSSIAATQIYTKLDFQHLAKIYDEKHPRARRLKPSQAEH